jgi:hypothetical protein
MGLDPSTASLGWKFDNDPQRAPPQRLSNTEDLQDAMVKAVGKIERARTRSVSIFVYNIVCASYFARFYLLILALECSPLCFSWNKALGSIRYMD